MNPNELIQRYLHGEATDAEVAELDLLLASDRALRRKLIVETGIDAGLCEIARERASQPSVGAPRRSVWLSWRPLTAAAAGIVFGMFCTSMVFAYVAPSLEKVVSLLQEDFESGPAPLVTGMPQEVNLWSGDFSEIVDKFKGVMPKDGTKMARVLRSDFEGKTASKPSLQGDLMRVVDVRPFLREANGGEVLITLSALFNAAPYPNAERYDGVVTLYALGQLGSTEESLLEDALAHSRGECRSLDRDPGSWQSASTRLLLPTGTEFVILKVSFRPGPASGASPSPLPNYVEFAGHFVDEVRATIRIHNAAPNHRNQGLR